MTVKTLLSHLVARKYSILPPVLYLEDGAPPLPGGVVLKVAVVVDAHGEGGVQNVDGAS